MPDPPFSHITPLCWLLCAACGGCGAPGSGLHMPAGSGHSWACRHAVSSTCSCRAGGCTPGGRHNHNLWLQLRVPDRALPLDPASFKQTTLGVVHGKLSWPSCRHHTSGMHETRLQTDHQLPGASPCCASSCLGSSLSSSQRRLTDRNCRWGASPPRAWQDYS